MGAPSQIAIISGLVLLFITIISLFGSLLTVFLIRNLAKWNSYILIVYCLSLCQCLYDLGFIFVIVAVSHSSFARVAHFFLTFGGVSVTIWTNIISVITLYIVFALRSFDVFRYFALYWTISILPAIALAIAQQICYNNDVPSYIYYWLRIASIALNFIVYISITIKVQQVEAIKNAGTVQLFQPGRSRNKSPLSELVSRMKYYPLVQVITRAGAAWYEYSYGFGSSSLPTSHSSSEELTAFFLNVVLSPAAGFGYFVVFLLMQPKAWRLLRRWIKKVFYCLIGKTYVDPKTTSRTTNALNESDASKVDVSVKKQNNISGYNGGTDPNTQNSQGNSNGEEIESVDNILQKNTELNRGVGKATGRTHSTAAMSVMTLSSESTTANSRLVSMLIYPQQVQQSFASQQIVHNGGKFNRTMSRDAEVFSTTLLALSPPSFSNNRTETNSEDSLTQMHLLTLHEMDEDELSVAIDIQNARNQQERRLNETDVRDLEYTAKLQKAPRTSTEMEMQFRMSDFPNSRPISTDSRTDGTSNMVEV